jgi:hypothetical protein
MHSRELHVLEMDLMSSSASSSFKLEMKGMTIWKSSGQLRLERTANHTLPMFMEFHFEDIVSSISLIVGGEISFAFGFWLNNSVGDIIEICLCKCWRYSITLVSGIQSHYARCRFPYPALEFISSTSEPQYSSQQDAP